MKKLNKEKQKSPIQYFIWVNKKHLSFMLKSTFYAGAYGTKYTSWDYDFKYGEFTFKKWKQIGKHEWSKEPTGGRVPASVLLYDQDNPNSKIWVQFLEAREQEGK
jgi:hypothetical protein